MPRRLLRLLDPIGRFGSRRRYPIFISYRRRGEGAGYAGRLADRLMREFGGDRCFRDIDDIESGTDFVEAISTAIGSCDVLVVVIAPDWLTATDANGHRRLDSPRDFVRIEIAAALARNTRVVPVLVGGATMPAPEELPAAIEGFARRQAHELSDLRWEYDVDQLVGIIERSGLKRVRTGRAQAQRAWRIAAAVGGASVVIWGATLLPDYVRTARVSPPVARADTVVLSAPDRGSAAAMPLTSVRQDADAASPERVRPPVDPLESERPRILAALRRGNDAEIRALHRLDPDPLHDAFTGEALRVELAAVQDLVAAGVHSVNELHDQRIRSMTLSDDGGEATVVAVETWSSEYHRNVDDACVARVPRHDVPQTVTLVRRAGGWIVARIRFPTDSPDPEPCG